MQNIAVWLNWILFSLIIIGSIAFIITSLIEKRWRAAGIMLIILIPLAGMCYIILLDILVAPAWLTFAPPVFFGVLSIIFIFPFGSNQPMKVKGEFNRVDERDAIFHRFYRLRPGMKEFDTYYQMYPEHKEIDEKTTRDAQPRRTRFQELRSSDITHERGHF